MVTVKDPRPLFASYEGSCDPEQRITELVRVFDAQGAPTDADFTITILESPRAVPMP